MHLLLPLLLSAGLFAIGSYGVLARRNAILVLLSVELMLNGANLSLVAYDRWWADVLHAGQSMAIFVITIGAAEIGLGLAIVLLLYRVRGDIAVDTTDDDTTDDDTTDDDTTAESHDETVAR